MKEEEEEEKKECYKNETSTNMNSQERILINVGIIIVINF